MSEESEPCDCESGFCNRLPNPFDGRFCRHDEDAWRDWAEQRIESLQSELALALEIVDERDHEIESLQRTIEKEQQQSNLRAEEIDRLLKEIDEDAAEITSLQRTNEELRKEKNTWIRRAQTRQDALNAARKEIGESEMLSQGIVPERLIDGAQANAITPEMREKAEAALAEYVSWQRYSKCVEVVRDLLKEPTLEGEQ